MNKSKQDKITNTDLYDRTNCESWSRTIKRRRLNWLGHLYRLPEETPARQALTEYNRKTKRPVGRPKPTWIAQINREIRPEDVAYANDRKAWKALVTRAMAT